MCKCLRRDDGTWHVDECCAWVVDEFHRSGHTPKEQVENEFGMAIMFELLPGNLQLYVARSVDDAEVEKCLLRWFDDIRSRSGKVKDILLDAVAEAREKGLTDAGLSE